MVSLEGGRLLRETGRGGAGTTPVIPSGSSEPLLSACSAAWRRRSPAPPGRGLKALAAAAADAAFRNAPAISPLDFLALIMGPKPGRISSSSVAACDEGAGPSSLSGVPASLFGSATLAGLFIAGSVSGAGDAGFRLSALGDFALVCSGDRDAGVALPGGGGGGVLRPLRFSAIDWPGR